MKSLVLLLAVLGACGQDIESVKAEPNLEKRSQLALDRAEASLAAAKKAYDAGDIAGFRESLKTIGELVNVSYSSLEDTGKRARRSPKWFKKAEQRLLVLQRRIGNLEKDVSIDDRESVVALRKHVSDVHDHILTDIMTKK